MHRLFIDGEWVNSSSNETFKRENPANPKEIVGTFQKGNVNDVRHAIEAAERAFDKWSSFPAPRRGEVLLKIARMLRERKEELARLVTVEMGKVISEGRGDVQEAIDITEYMAGEGRRLFGFTTPSELKDKFCMTIRRPVGVAGLITPWNFPFAIPAWKIMPALICGNTTVFKPARDTSLCATRLVEIIERAGVPKGVVNLVTGYGEDIGTELVKNPKIRCVSFTGSKEVGEQVLKNSGIKKVGLELGGKNAIIVMEDADIRLALEGVLWGAFGTTGQRCTATSRVIIHKKIKKKFESLLVKRAKALRLGNGISSATDIGPLVNSKAVEKVHMYTKVGIEEGAKLLLGGEGLKTEGHFYKPTIFTDVTSDMRIAREEIFGPTLSLVSFDGIDEAIEICNSVDYGLVSSIYTNSMKNAFEAIEKIDTGLTYINASTIGSEVHLPFGGVKGTGNGGREAGIEGVNEFSETKTVYIDFSGKLQKAQIELVKLEE